MDTVKANKSQMYCTIAMALVVGGYAIERIISIMFNPGKTMGIIMAMVYTVLVGVVYLLITKSEDVFSSLLASMLAYKMLPPSISSLSKASIDAGMLYYVVKQISVVVFLLMILKLYEKQPKPRPIKPLALLGIMVIIPFFAEIGYKFDTYFLAKTGSMLYVYYTDFACYAIATLFILLFAYRSGKESMMFTATFEYIALGINILRRAMVVIVNLVAHEHISKSYYVWIVLYIALICITAVFKKKALKEA